MPNKVARLTLFVDRLGTYGPSGKCWASLSCDYDADFIDTLKGMMPKADRHWNPYQKVWYFDPSMLAFVEEALQDFQYDFYVDPVLNREKNDFEVLQIDRQACYEVAKAAYKVLCMIHHPDRGGDVEAMKLVNAAWERVRRKWES